jgi:hypothetical protein
MQTGHCFVAEIRPVENRGMVKEACNGAEK